MLNYPVLIFSAVAVFGAGIVKGFSGFGFSMIMMISLSFVLPPAEIVPMILLWEISADIWLLPRIWRQVGWVSIAWMLLGVSIGTPFGLYLLKHIPAKPMQAGISATVILLVVMIWRGLRIAKNSGRLTAVGIGTVCGILNGAATIGGPPAVLFYYSSTGDLVSSRASLIAFFLATDLFATGLCATQGLLTTKSVAMTGILLIPLALGLTLGSRSFIRTDQETFRKSVMVLLVILSIAAFSQAIL
jgi:uncharacterized membrane protein YfcA